MTREEVVIWAGPSSPDKTKGIALVRDASTNKAILMVMNDQGYSSLVLEPTRDLATLVEAVQILVAQVVSGQRRKGAKKASR